VGITGFRGHLFGFYFSLIPEGHRSSSWWFCPVLCLSCSLISNLYGRQDSLRARKGESPGPCAFGVKSSG